MERDFYEETFRAESRSWWHLGRRAVLARVLERGLAEAGMGGDIELLDVGCGTAGTTAFLAAGRRVVGCDAAPEALALARHRGLAGLVRADAAALPFSAARFDVALALDVLEHHDDDRAVAAEAWRVLRPGGLLLATVPAFAALWGPHDVLSHHRRRYRLPELTRILHAAGFEIRRASYFNSALFPIVLAVQLVRRLLRAGGPAAAASDLPRRMPRLLNSALAVAFAAERHVVSRVRLPFGVSALAVARRPLGTAP
jgi:SAM-dependent methyltransferase